MATITINRFERAIYAWCVQHPTTNHALCKQARVLCDVYGEMIYFHRDTVDETSLTPAQVQALAIVD